MEIKNLKPFDQRRKPKFTYPDGKIVLAELVDELEVETPSRDGKKIYKRLVQKFIWDDDKREEFRFCYYYRDISNPNSKWVFGQYALMFTPEQFKQMLEMMKGKGWV